MKPLNSRALMNDRFMKAMFVSVISFGQTAIVAAGLYATWVRFAQGLGAATNLSDHFAWRLWIGFDVLCGVGLAAGGFAITATVVIFHLDRFRPILRPTVLTAFLGYLLVIVALLFDLMVARIASGTRW